MNERKKEGRKEGRKERMNEKMKLNKRKIWERRDSN
jgi:hypothetical protein